VFIDPKSNDFSIYDGATCITPNLKEFEAVVGPCETETDIIQKARGLLGQLHLEYLLVTRGKDGMSLFHNSDEETHIPTEAKEVFDVTGAGDTVIATLALAYASKADISTSVKLANAAAGVVVGKLGSATCSVPELQRAIQKTPAGGILNEEQLLIEIQHAKIAGEKVVFTNGCFDILHAGHVHYLNEAKKLGDRLIIAVNDDDSVKRLKGDSRPINSLEKRMIVLAGLNAVDWVVPFSEDTPERLICHLLPDVLVKGGDYKPEEIAGFNCVIKNGGEVKVLDFVEGCSTTAMIEKARTEK
jgi:D-beta-D-heptose 7-phosphate kinase/D-beta-D-heptose 1-phosphate adenosyltransferase